MTAHPINERNLTELASRLLDAATAAAPGAEAVAVIERTELALTRFANSAIHQNVAEDTLLARLQLHLDGRTTVVSSALADEAALGALIASALDAVRSGPSDPGWPGLTAPADPPPSPTAHIEMSTAAQRAGTVRSFVDAAGGLTTAGYCRTRIDSTAFVNSAGQDVSARTVDATVDGIARLEGVDGVARASANELGSIDAVALGRRAAAKVRDGQRPAEFAARRYEVVLEPPAVIDILSNMAMAGFNGRAVLDGRSFAQLGRDQFDRSITIYDDGPSCGETIDVEGTPRPRRTFVERGRTAAIAHDRRTAHEAGTDSTGHSLGSAQFGAVPVHLGLEPGTGDAEPPGSAGLLVHPSAVPLVAGVDDGLLVSDFWYTRVLDPRSLAITGLTRNGVWRIRDGAIAEPVQNFRFTQAYPAALAPGSVLGLGHVADAQPDGWLPARWTAPAVHLGSWNFTGTSSG